MITDLWLSGKLPGWDGLYRADGSAWAARIDDSVPNGFVLMAPLGLTAMLRDSPEWVTEYDITTERQLPDCSGYLCCGEAAHGSEGFFARLDAGRDLVWVAYFEDSNPFVEIAFEGNRAVVTSNLGRPVLIDLDDPDFRPAAR